MTIAIHAVQDVAITGGGPTQSFTKAAAGTCKGAIFFATPTTAAGTAVANANLGIGACDGTRQYAHAQSATDGSSPTRCDRRGVTNACVFSVGNDGAVTAKAAFSSFVTDGVQITWSTFPPAGWLIQALLFFDDGADLTFYCNTATASGPNGTVTSIDGPGAQPDVVIASSFGSAFSDSVSSDSATMLGFACRKSPIQQATLDFFSNDNDTVTKDGGGISNNRLLFHASHGGLSRAIELTAFDSLGFDVTHRAGSSGSNLDFGYVSLAFNGANDYWCGVVDAPIATGDWPILNPAMYPLVTMLLPNMIDTVNSAKVDSQAGTFGVSLFTATDEMGLSLAAEDNVIPMDTQALSDNTRAVSLPDHGGVAANGFQSSNSTAPTFNDEGFTLSFTTVGPSTKRKWPALVIEDPGGSGDPPANPMSRSYSQGFVG